MVLFRQVLIEKDTKIASLTNLNFMSMKKVLTNGGWNVVNLTSDRTIYFDKEKEGKYGLYDFDVLKDSSEVFDEVFLFKYEPTKIESSISRRELLFQNQFVEVKVSKEEQEKISSSSNIDQQLAEHNIETIANSSLYKTMSIINLKNDEHCEISFDQIKSLSDDNFVQELEDDEETKETCICIEERVKAPIEQSQEDKLNYAERTILNYQKLTLEKVSDFLLSMAIGVLNFLVRQDR